MSRREGLIEVEKLIEPGRELSEKTISKLKKQEHEYLIARIGLQGTLWGAWACLIVIILIVASPVFTTRNIVEGWEVVTIVVAMVVSIVFYGTFIFKRALTATGKYGKAAIEVATPTEREMNRSETAARPRQEVRLKEMRADVEEG